MEEKRGWLQLSSNSVKNTFSNTIVLLLLTTTTLLPLSAGSAVTDDDDHPPMALPSCQDHCGGVTIPYPFSIGDTCSHNPFFTILCSNNFNKPSLLTLTWTMPVTPLLGPDFHTFRLAPAPAPTPGDTAGSEVTEITLQMVSEPTLRPEYAPTNSVSIKGSFDKLQFFGDTLYARKHLNMTGTPFRLMGAGRNAVVVGGCSGGVVVLRDKINRTVAGCATACMEGATRGRDRTSCYGIECCQSAIPTSHDFIEMDFLSLHSNVSEVVSAAVVDLSYLPDKVVDRSLSAFTDAPTLLQWRVDDLPIDSPEYANSLCDKGDWGYTCTCRREYHHGNPYLPNGCRAIRACQQCPDDCISAGNNTFHCPQQLPTSADNVVPQGLVLGFGITLASVFMLILLYVLYQFLKKRKEVMKKMNNFKKNGGLLLQQHTGTNDGFIERIKLFTSNELEKATDDFNENRVLGRGGQGTVYKGMLVDGTIVAIKKSKKVSEKQLEQFINEVVILSQVNHRNVVKLYGCCLETDVPLLVHEYVPNGTLYQHIHKPDEDFQITWKMRLRIATESAEALAYLHSWSFSPIYHMDIKTSNILLDDKYKAKVSDFGTSKTLSMDQTHLTTQVQGTIGYMDPEFLQSSQFTEKSDVYSFGIVLLELLTRKKPIYLDKFEMPKILASEFLAAVRNSHLHDIVDAQVLEEAGEQEIEGVANLARRCLNLNGRARPTMKEVAMALQMVSSQGSAPNILLQQTDEINIFQQQEFINTEEMIVGQIVTNNGGILSTSSTYGPR